MIFTIGYQKLTAQDLLTIACALSATVIDARSNPASRKPGFSKKALTTMFGTSYEWWGETLGGKGKVPTGTEAIEAFRQRARGVNVLLMCLEESPLQCHRHYWICGPHFPRAKHIYRNEIIRVSDLNKAIEADAELYPVREFLEDLVPSLR